jgi:hypothetical protein
VWEALLHIVGAINYGGRVTHPEDRKLLAAIMQQHLSAEVLTGSIQLARTGWDGSFLLGEGGTVTSSGMLTAEWYWSMMMVA